MDSSFCLRIALFNFMGYCTGTLTACLLDSRLMTHAEYPPRKYRYGWIWILLSPILPLCTYFLLRRLESTGPVLLASFALLIVFGFTASLGFPPERPHAGIFAYTFGVALLSFVTAWFHLSRVTLNFIQNTDVPFAARLESVKATALTWQMIAVYASVGYLAFVISWVYVLSVITQFTVNSQRDRFAMGRAGIFQILSVSVCVILGPLWEAFNNAAAAIAQLSELRK
jgi:hypothetical protein